MIKLLAGLLPLLSTSLLAQPKPDSTASISHKLDEFLSSATQTYRFNGVALVARQGEILLHKGYGWRDAAQKSHNDTSIIFPILSMTKSFTAIAVLHLQDQGKLSVNDPLSKYFPDFPKGNSILLRHLLSHTSGIHNYTEDIGEEDSAIICYPVDKQWILDLIYKKPRDFKPGRQYSYNNSGFFLLGMIIEKVTGKSYEQVIRDLIFEPVGMHHSGFDFVHLPEPSKARGYTRLNNREQLPSKPWDSTVSYAAGSIYSTTSDLYKWARAIARHQLITKSSWTQAFTPNLERYGYGWWIDTLLGRRYVTTAAAVSGLCPTSCIIPAKM